jgi:hypothetical protein
LSTLPSHVKLNGGLAAGKSGGGGVLTTDMIDSLGPCAPYRELLRSGFRRPWIARVLQLHLHLARLSVRRARPSAPALPSPHVSHCTCCLNPCFNSMPATVTPRAAR